MGPTNYPLSEEEWPQLPGKNCQERNKLITCQRKTDEPVGAEKQKWVEQTAAVIPIRVAASDLAVSSSAGSRAASQAGTTTATTGDNLCKLGKKIDTTGSSEEKVQARIAESAPPKAEFESSEAQAITGNSRHFGPSEQSKKLTEQIKSTERLIKMAASTGELDINQLIERLDKGNS